MTITQRVTSAAADDITKRVIVSAAVASVSYDPWGGTWGRTWGNTWLAFTTAESASPLIDVTLRVTGQAAADLTGRVSAAPVADSEQRVTQSPVAANTKRVTM